MADPVAQQARMVAAAFRQKGLGDVADMIDYLANAADEQWDAETGRLARLVPKNDDYLAARAIVDLHGEPSESVIRRQRGE